MICSKLLQPPTRGFWNPEYPLKFFYEESSIGQPIDEAQKVNLANDMRHYPSSVGARIEQALVNLSRRYSSVGEIILPIWRDTPLLFCETTSESEESAESAGIFSFLAELGYIQDIGKEDYIISAKGWQKVYELTEKENEIQQGFIAMAFCNETDSIGRAFAEAIKNCGYVPRRIDQKEHNNQIVPEIFYEISRSKFMVVDVTVPNYGAYYEAGYGEALKKQVIVCCRRSTFESKNNRPHFDIAQKSTIIWEDEEDLRKKLERRIEATVGLNR